jgi:hypothetical protein
MQGAVNLTILPAATRVPAAGYCAVTSEVPQAHVAGNNCASETAFTAACVVSPTTLGVVTNIVGGVTGSLPKYASVSVILSSAPTNELLGDVCVGAVTISRV